MGPRPALRFDVVVNQRQQTCLTSLAEHGIKDLQEPGKLLVVEPGQRGRFGHLCPNPLHQRFTCRGKLHPAHTTIGSVCHPHDQATKFEPVDGHGGQGRVAGEVVSDATHGQVAGCQQLPQQFDVRGRQIHIGSHLFPTLGDFCDHSQHQVGNLRYQLVTAHIACHVPIVVGA